MTLRVKTTDDFERKNYRFKRVKTIDSQIYMNKPQTAEDNIRHRIKTMISKTDNYLEKQIQLRTQSKISVAASPMKTPRRIDKYDEDNQNLTHDFATDWSRMDTIKRQTYDRLRSKFVKKFPSFRQKYKKQDLDEEEVENKVSTKRSSSLNKTYRQSEYMETVPHQSKSISNAVIKVACFYSRSQKKCLYNSFTQDPIEQTQKEMPMPRMSFMTYLKNHKERDILKIKRIKGQNLIKTRQNILRLEKEGTKSFINLKKCLDESIQTCIRGK